VRQRFVRFEIILFALALVIGLSACASATPKSELTHVRLAMGYVPTVQYAPFYVADEKGYFAANGIDVEFDHSIYESDAVKRLGTDELQFANVSGEQVLLARAQGIPLVYVFELWQRYPIAVVSKSEMGIVEPANLAGHMVGLPMQSGASYTGWQALLSAADLTEDDVSTEVIGFTQVTSVSEDVVEAAVVYANNEPIQLAQSGYDVNVITVSDYIDLVATGLVTNERTLAESPDLVQGMVDALALGLADVIADPDEAFTICQNYVEGLDGEAADIQRMVLDASIAMWGAEQLGYSDLSAWEQTQTLLLDTGLLTEPQDLEAVFTNELLP
jgi:NitT/TauT family transport system substrate-binding protein